MTVVEANGARIPAIGLGTMTLKEQVCIDAMKTALRLGYRHLDTAERYGNEEWVGEGLHQGLAAIRPQARGRLRHHESLLGQARARRLRALGRGEPQKLKLPWVDLLLIHWNNPKVPLSDSIGSLCKAKSKGQAKHVGVANFTVCNAR